MQHSEVVFTNLIFPCLEAMVKLMKEHKQKPYFVPGEEGLELMASVLKNLGEKFDNRKIYKADGVVRLGGHEDTEILVLETAGPFNMDDNSKITFDNSKGMLSCWQC